MTNEENNSQPPEEKITIGAYLKQMREKKKLTVKIISQHTKINSSKLELLEADRLSELPNQAYVVGYVKSYSRTLGLDQQYCLNLLDQAYGKNQEAIPQQQLQKLSEANKPRVEASSDHSLAKIVAGVAAIAVVIGILAFLSQREQLESSSDELAQDEPAIIQEKVEPKTEEEVLVDTVAPDSELAPDQTPTPPPQAEPVTTQAQVVPEPAAEPVAEKKPEPVVKNDPVKENNVKEEIEKKRTFRPVIGPTYELSTISAAEKDRVYPANLRSSGTNGEYHVYIKADTDDTWITYKTDDEDARRFVLQKDRHVILRGKIHRLFLGNANATKIFVNGQLIEVDSRTGVKSIIIPNEVRTNYSLPLFVYPADGSVLTSEEVMAAQKAKEE